MRKAGPDSLMKNSYKIYLFALLSMLFWGFSFVWVKVVYAHEYRPIMTIFIRLVISSVILFLFVKIARKEQKIEKADYGKFVLLSFFQPFLYFMGESFGLTLVTSTVAAVIVSTIPVITPVFSYAFLKERISPFNLAGMLISFAGILLMVVDRDYNFAASPLGIILEFSAVLAAIFYSIVVKKLAYKYSTFTIIKTQNFLGALFFLPLFLIFDFNQFISVRPDAELIYSMILLSVFASSGAYLLYIPVVKELGINKANMFTNIIPVFTAITSFFVLSEAFDLNKIAGMAVVISGVIVSQIYKKKKNNLNTSL